MSVSHVNSCFAGDCSGPGIGDWIFFFPPVLLENKLLSSRGEKKEEETKPVLTVKGLHLPKKLSGAWILL